MIIEVIKTKNGAIDKFGQANIKVSIKRNISKTNRDVLICFSSMLLVVNKNARRIKTIDNDIKISFEI